MIEYKFEPRQIEGYRAMTGEQRVEITFQLNALVRDIARDGIRAQHPEFSPDEIESELQKRINYGRTGTL